MIAPLLLGMVLAAGDDDGGRTDRTVANPRELHEALAVAKAGTTIRIAPGRYPGGFSLRDLHGTPDRPITVTAAVPDDPPVFEGNNTGLHGSAVSYLELSRLVIVGAADNGINIDDGGRLDHPSHHIVLRELTVRDIGPDGNHDGIKLSGVDDFRVIGCAIERWGRRGSGIDMVGCHRGVIEDCRFEHGDEAGSHGVQAKGGSARVLIRGCRFEHAGQRAVNLGGSTGLAYFRPKPEGFEARAITVEDCTFRGSNAAVAFVGADGAIVRHNTIYRPRRWAFRILQETREPGFVPCRGGVITDNLIVFRADEMAVPLNIGDATDPASFTMARNAWYCLDAPARSRPALPIPETDGAYGVDPRLGGDDHADLRIGADPPAPAPGARRAGSRNDDP